MKKCFAVLLAVLMIAAFAGCTGTQENPVVDIGAATVPPVEETPEPGGEGLGLKREGLGATGMVAAGDIHSLGLRTDGSVLSAGHNYYDQREVTDWTDVVYIAAGKTVSLGVKADGTLAVAGSLADASALETVAAWTNVYSVDAGADHVVAVLNDGKAVAAGDNSKGQCDVSAWSDIVAVACGDAFTVGLTGAGTVVATAGAPTQILEWKDIKSIAAGGESAVVALNNESKLVATCDITGLEALNDIVSFGADDCGVAAVRADGTVVTALLPDIAPDGIYMQGIVDLTTVADAVSVAVGDKHVVVMRRDGTAAAYGVNDDLQCDVGRFNLRPYTEQLADTSFVVRGLEIGMTVAEAKTLVAVTTGAADVQFAKVTPGAEGAEATSTPCADTDVVATGLNITCDGTLYGTVVLLGDVDENGAIDDADRSLVEQISTSAIRPGGYITRSAQLETSMTGIPACTEKSLKLMDEIIAGTYRLSQFSHKTTGVYEERISVARSENKDTVGWVTIPQTNIDYQIMFDTKGKWYYNDHTPEKKQADSGSIYAYYYSPDGLKNTVFTGHNSRPSGSMFHQLHHIQEFNLGNATCAQTKYCGMELVGLPDLQKYSNRVWTVNLFGEETAWEVFAMYETEPGDEAYDIFLDNVWWPWGDENYDKTTDEQIQKWLDEQIERSEVQIDTKVTTQDKYLTVFTCGNEHADSNKYSRLYFILVQVD